MPNVDKAAISTRHPNEVRLGALPESTTAGVIDGFPVRSVAHQRIALHDYPRVEGVAPVFLQPLVFEGTPARRRQSSPRLWSLSHLPPYRTKALPPKGRAHHRLTHRLWPPQKSFPDGQFAAALERRNTRQTPTITKILSEQPPPLAAPPQHRSQEWVVPPSIAPCRRALSPRRWLQPASGRWWC